MSAAAAFFAFGFRSAALPEQITLLTLRGFLRQHFLKREAVFFDVLVYSE
jgi:hypothetical protein